MNLAILLEPLNLSLLLILVVVLAFIGVTLWVCRDLEKTIEVLQQEEEKVRYRARARSSC